MRLLWITNIPSPYRVDFFNELGKSCELTVLFEKAGASDRDDTWLGFQFDHFEGVVMRGVSYAADSAACPEVLVHLRRRAYDAVIVTSFSSPTGVIAIAYLKATGKPYYLESDGGFPSGSRLKSWAKRRVIGGAKGYFSTSDVHDEYYLAHGALPHQLIRYPFTSVHADEVLREPPTAAEKEAAKRELGFREPKMVLAVGRFIQVKGFDVLIRSSPALGDDTVVLIVGGEPTREYRHLAAEVGASSVRFAGFRPRPELSLYFTAADVFALPTRGDAWGLVINEALAHGLPVVTTDRCVAGLELVGKSGCGRIVPDGDVEGLSKELDLLLNDAELRSEMQVSALRVARGYTIEAMAQRHLDVLRQGGHQQ